MKNKNKPLGKTEASASADSSQIDDIATQVDASLPLDTDPASESSSQTLELPENLIEAAPRDAARIFKQEKANIKNGAKNYAKMGQSFLKIRRLGLWRSSRSPKFKSFAEFYRSMGYTADQVCHLMAISVVLMALIREFGKDPVKITIFHAMVILTAVRSKENRFEANVELACQIFRDVFKENGKVTGKLLRLKMVELKLVQPPKDPKKVPGDNDNVDVASLDGASGDAEAGNSTEEGLNLGETPDENGHTADRPQKTGSEAAVTTVFTDEVRCEFEEARALAASLVNKTDSLKGEIELHRELVRLRTLLENVWGKIDK